MLKFSLTSSSCILLQMVSCTCIVCFNMFTNWLLVLQASKPTRRLASMHSKGNTGKKVLITDIIFFSFLSRGNHQRESTVTSTEEYNSPYEDPFFLPTASDDTWKHCIAARCAKIKLNYIEEVSLNTLHNFVCNFVFSGSNRRVLPRSYSMLWHTKRSTSEEIWEWSKVQC